MQQYSIPCSIESQVFCIRNTFIDVSTEQSPSLKPSIHGRRSQSCPPNRIRSLNGAFQMQESRGEEEAIKHQLASPRSTSAGSSDSDAAESCPSTDLSEDHLSSGNHSVALQGTPTGLSTPETYGLPVYGFFQFPASTPACTCPAPYLVCENARACQDFVTPVPPTGPLEKSQHMVLSLADILDDNVVTSPMLPSMPATSTNPSTSSEVCLSKDNSDMQWFVPESRWSVGGALNIETATYSAGTCAQGWHYQQECSLYAQTQNESVWCGDACLEASACSSVVGSGEVLSRGGLMQGTTECGSLPWSCAQVQTATAYRPSFSRHGGEIADAWTGLASTQAKQFALRDDLSSSDAENDSDHGTWGFTRPREPVNAMFPAASRNPVQTSSLEASSADEHLVLTPSRPAVGSEQLPSLGSVGHDDHSCKPCAFFHLGRCENAAACRFCHRCEPTERKRRRKAKHANRQSAASVEKNF